MNTTSRRETCLIGGVMLVAMGAFADTRKVDPDFYQWIDYAQGRHASLAQMKQHCDQVLAADKNLNCSVTVLARMFEAKAANQLPCIPLSKKQSSQPDPRSPKCPLHFIALIFQHSMLAI